MVKYRDVILSNHHSPLASPHRRPSTAAYQRPTNATNLSPNHCVLQFSTFLKMNRLTSLT